jgi:hypothetical protein
MCLIWAKLYVMCISVKVEGGKIMLHQVSLKITVR